MDDVLADLLWGEGATPPSANSVTLELPKGADEPKKRRPRPSGTTLRRQELAEAEAKYLELLKQVQALESGRSEAAARAWVLEQVLAARDSLAVRKQELEAGPLAGTDDPFVSLGFTVEEAKTASVQQLLRILRSCQENLGRELLQCELQGAPTPKLLEMADAMILACHFAPAYQPGLPVLNSLHVDSVLPPGAHTSSCVDTMPKPPPDHWRKVAIEAKLRPAALQQCRILDQLVAGWLQRIMVERRALTQALEDCIRNAKAVYGSAPLPYTPAQPDVVPGGLARASISLTTGVSSQGLLAELTSSLHAAAHAQSGTSEMLGASQSTDEEDVTQRLADNIERERAMVCLASEVLYCRILDRMEGVRLLVHSYPWVPDDMCILQNLATLANEQGTGKSENAAPK